MCYYPVTYEEARDSVDFDGNSHLFEPEYVDEGLNHMDLAKSI